MNYYNENEPNAAAWLLGLIEDGLIPKGHVDVRSITEVQAADLVGYTQHHFFAGIAGWSFALRIAGWDDDRPVITGSCPCQPFSAAGKGKGESDDRHLWPEFARIIRGLRELGSVAPVMGEQVASKLGRVWLSRVRSDLEEMAHGVWAVDLCSASVGSPNIRQRLFWMAYCKGSGTWESQRRLWKVDSGYSEVGWLADANGGNTGSEWQQRSGEQRLQQEDGGTGRLADAEPERAWGRAGQVWQAELGRNRSSEYGSTGQSLRLGDTNDSGLQGRSIDRERTGELSVGPTMPWCEYDVVHCRDGKSRRIPKNGSQPYILSVADGFFYRMADVYAAFAEEALIEVDSYAKKTGSNSDKVLQMVYEAIREREVEREAGRQNDFQEEEVLLTFMLSKLSARKGASVSSFSKDTSSENDRRMLRDLRKNIQSECASLRRESNEQLDGQPSNSMLALSQFLARCCQACRDHKARSYALSFPLSGKVAGRPRILKGIGNAINPYVAAQFIRSFMEDV